MKEIISPQLIFNIIYGAVLTSPLLGGEYTLLLALVGYANFMTIAKDRKIDQIVKICTIGVIISVLVALILFVIHWDQMLAGLGQPTDTIVSVGWFAIAFMIIDAVRFQIARYEIDLQQFARFTLILTFATIIGKIVWIYVAGNVTGIGELFQTTDRNIKLLDLNPNHADNIIIYTSMLIIWLAIWIRQFLNYKLLLLATIITGSYLVFLIVVINTRAAFIGLFVALITILITDIRRIPKPAIFAIIGLLIALPFILPNSVISRFQSGSEQILKLYHQSASDIEELRLQNARLKQDVINALKDESEIPLSERIAKICFDQTPHGLLPTAYNTDTATSFRILLYLDGYQLWKDRPFWGYGKYDKLELIQNSEKIDPCHIGFFSHIHNYYLNVMLRGGIFALAVFAVLSCLLFLLLLQDRKSSYRLNTLAHLPIFIYFVYLYVDNLFDLAFHRDAPLSAVLFSLSVMLAINLVNPVEPAVEIPARNG